MGFLQDTVPAHSLQACVSVDLTRQKFSCFNIWNHSDICQVENGRSHESFPPRAKTSTRPVAQGEMLCSWLMIYITLNCLQKLKQKNQQLKQIMDQLRNLIWEINSMLAIRSWDATGQKQVRRTGLVPVNRSPRSGWGIRSYDGWHLQRTPRELMKRYSVYLHTSSVGNTFSLVDIRTVWRLEYIKLL